MKKASNAKERSYRDLDPNATIFILTDNVTRAPKKYEGQVAIASDDKIDRNPYSTLMDSLVRYLSSELPSIAIRTASSGKSKLGSSSGSNLASVVNRVESKTPVLCLDLRDRKMEMKSMMTFMRERYLQAVTEKGAANPATFNELEFVELVSQLAKPVSTSEIARPVATSTSATAGATNAVGAAQADKSSLWKRLATAVVSEAEPPNPKIAEAFKEYANADGLLDYCKLSSALHDPVLRDFSRDFSLNLSNMALERRTDHVTSVKALINAKHKSLLCIEEEGVSVSSQETVSVLDMPRKKPLNDTLDCCDLALLHEALHGEDMSPLGQEAKGQRQIVMLHEAIRKKKKDEVGEVDVDNSTLAQPTPQMITETAAWLSDLIFSNAFDLLGTKEQKDLRLAELAKELDKAACKLETELVEKGKSDAGNSITKLKKALYKEGNDCEPHTSLNSYP